MRSKKSSVNEDFLAQYRNTTDNSDDYYPQNRASRVERKSKSKSRSSAKSKKDNIKESKKIDKSSAKRKKIAKNTRKRKHRKWPYIIIVILLLISAAIGLTLTFISAQIDKMHHIDTSNETFGIYDEVAENLKNYESYAILGLDARPWDDASKSRTDSIIIATLNKKTGEVDLTSVMRDSTLVMHNEQKKDIFDKATHAHVYGGPINTVTMLNRSLDLNIKKFLVLNWKAVSDMIDAMGGVEVEVHKNEIHDMNKFMIETALNLQKDPVPIKKAGVQKLDGVQAVTFCRIRETSGGDVGRGSRTKIVISALFDAVKKNPTKIPDMADKGFPSITTNVDTSDVLNLLPKLFKLEIKSSSVYPHEFWGGIEGDAWVAIPTNLEKNAAHLYKKVFPDVDYRPSRELRELDKKLTNKFGPKKTTEKNEDDSENKE